jgi:plasmid stabilization system protein ParE
MAARSRRRKVTVSTAVLEKLREIWRWNAEHHGPDHADSYLEFLETALGTLARPEVDGRSVAGRPDLRYLFIRRRSGNHGHIAVFHVGAGVVTVLHLFHSAQDWQTALASEGPIS